MNKLYVIKWMYRGYNLKTSYFWNLCELEEDIVEHPDFEFELIENNDTHMIYEAR